MGWCRARVAATLATGLALTLPSVPAHARFPPEMPPQAEWPPDPSVPPPEPTPQLRYERRTKGLTAGVVLSSLVTVPGLLMLWMSLPRDPADHTAMFPAGVGLTLLGGTVLSTTAPALAHHRRWDRPDQFIDVYEAQRQRRRVLVTLGVAAGTLLAGGLTLVVGTVHRNRCERSEEGASCPGPMAAQYSGGGLLVAGGSALLVTGTLAGMFSAHGEPELEVSLRPGGLTLRF